MTLYIPKEKWTNFFNDLSKRRFGWETKIEVLAESVGDQILSEGLPLNGVTYESKLNKIEILVGENTEHHQTHNIINPVRVAFLSEEEYQTGILEIEEEKGTRTLVRIINPMPVHVGYINYQIVATA